MSIYNRLYLRQLNKKTKMYQINLTETRRQYRTKELNCQIKAAFHI